MDVRGRDWTEKKAVQIVEPGPCSRAILEGSEVRVKGISTLELSKSERESERGPS